MASGKPVLQKALRTWRRWDGRRRQVLAASVVGEFRRNDFDDVVVGHRRHRRQVGGVVHVKVVRQVGMRTAGNEKQFRSEVCVSMMPNFFEKFAKAVGRTWDLFLFSFSQAAP